MDDREPNSDPHRDPPTRRDDDTADETPDETSERSDSRFADPAPHTSGLEGAPDAEALTPTERWLAAAADSAAATGGPPVRNRLGPWLLPLLALLAVTALLAPRLDNATAPHPDPALLQAAGPPPVVAPTGALADAYEARRAASVRVEAYCSGTAFATPLGIGTGFFIGEDGTLLTAYHVIDPSNAPCRVEHRAVGPDETSYPLELVGFDAYFDLAVMHAEVDAPLPFVPLAARGPRPGDEIVAIGNSRNDFLKARAGQVTRLGVRAARANFADETIELTAALAPGDSGGPVLNRAGEAVGVVSYISFNPGALDAEGYIPPFLLGLARPDFASYAVPVGAENELLTALLAGERRDVPVVGLSWGGGFDSGYVPGQTAIDLGPRAGTIIQNVAPGGPAEQAGLRPLRQRPRLDADGRAVGVDVDADVVVAVDGEVTADLDELMRIVRSYRIGDSVTLTVQRGNATLQIELELGASRTVFGGVE